MLVNLLSFIETDEDKTYFTDLYNKHKDMMFSIADNILSDDSLSEDAVNDAFLKIIEHFETVKNINEDKVIGYIIVVTQNCAKKIYKKQKKYSFTKFEDTKSNLSADDIFFANAGKSDDNFPEKLEYNLILESISEMKPVYRDTLLLKFYHGCSNKEIADIFGISESTVRKRVERARKILREKTEGINEETRDK